MSTWVVVADSSRARIFVAETAIAPLAEIKAFEHPQGRMHDRDLTSDLPGRSFDSKGNARHAMEPHTDPKHEQAVEFAREIAAYLDAGRNNKDYAQLAIVAAPSFLGLLREQMNGQLSKLVSYELNKNLSQMNAVDIRKHMPERIPLLG